MRLFITLLITIAVMYSCSTKTAPSDPGIIFGIHEVIVASDLPEAVLEELNTGNFIFEKDSSMPIIGYITISDTSDLLSEISTHEILFARTYYPVDPEKNYYGVAALIPKPGLDNGDIQKAKYRENTVEINFTLEGAKKWSEFTKKNVGSPLAFLIDGKIYAMPMVQAEIRIGMAVISDLESEEFARGIAERLNGD